MGEADAASLGRGDCASTRFSELHTVQWKKEAMEGDKKMQSSKKKLAQ
jgi:hypothetical protein